MTKARRTRILLALPLLLGVLTAEKPFSIQASDFTLAAPVWNNGQAQFTVNGCCGFNCLIQYSPDLQNWTPIFTNFDTAATRVVNTDAPNEIGFYRGALGRMPLFVSAIAAVQTIDLQTNSVNIDSFDSGNTNYSVVGQYPFGDVTKSKANGDVCTDSTLVDALNVGNANIKGHVRTGTGTNTVSTGPSGTVGDRAWVEEGHSGVKPGWFSSDFSLAFPDAAVPDDIYLYYPVSGVINGVRYSYTTQGGDFLFFTSSLKWSIWVGTNASMRLWVTGDSTGSTAYTNVVRICPGARLKIYLGGNLNIAGSYSVDNQSHRADSFVLYGLPACTNISLGFTNKFEGCVYAPQADLTLGAGENIPWEFVGATVAKTVTVNGQGNFHYDENLRRVGPFR